LPASSSSEQTTTAAESWLNRTTFGVGLTSLFSDWSHEIATAILPAFLASIGAGPLWLGMIEGFADGLSSAVKLAAGHFTDLLRRRKPLVLAGYVVTAAGTGALGLATKPLHVLTARVGAWLGRGARTPGRKALMAAAVPPGAYGRAFGFERLMDTVGAIVGPLTAVWLLARSANDYSRVFLWTLVPGLAAVLVFALAVKERPHGPHEPLPFWSGLRALPASFQRFLLAAGIFGLGDFSHTLLILYATRALTPERGAAVAARVAIGLYVLHNIFYASFAYLAGWLGDHRPRRQVLAAGYAVAGAMALLLVIGSNQLPMLVLIFALAGIAVGAEEALEDSLAAELVPRSQHGMAFGTLAAVNAAGDFGSSVLVGLLWSAVSPQAAFGAAAVLFVAGAVMILRLR
jgi:MFS family permease